MSRLLRLPEVAAMCGLKRSAIYEAIKKREFPPPIPLGSSRSVAWISSEIYNWIDAQIRAARGDRPETPQ